jgi:hypothetical protein
MPINYVRIAVASVAAFIAYMGTGALMFAALPMVREEFRKYPGVYRGHEGQMSHMPLGMAGILVAMVALALLYARLYRGVSGLAEGALFGVLIAVFVLGAFVLHNHANLNIGPALTAYSAIAYCIEWLIAGIVIGLVYRPA